MVNILSVSFDRRCPMFSLAVSIPYNSTTELYDTSQVADTGDQVRERIVNDCEVYNGARAVAATVLRWPNVLDQCPDKPVQWPNVLAKCGPALKTWADFKECHDAELIMQSTVLCSTLTPWSTIITTMICSCFPMWQKMYGWIKSLEHYSKHKKGSELG